MPPPTNPSSGLKLSNSKKRKVPYPYDIPSIECPPEKILKKLNGWNVLEFLRIEALLRSPTVQTAFRKGYFNFRRELSDNFRVLPWKVLEGEHHCLIQKTHLWPDGGVIDVSALRKNLSAAAVIDAMSLHYDNPRFLHLQIDLTVPHKTLILALRLKLRDKKQELIPDHMMRSAQHEIDRITRRDPSQRTPTYKLEVWIRYFNCYDLRETKGLSFGKIGLKVYKDSGQKAYDRAESACQRVSQLIRFAETKQWPPDIS